LGVLRPGLVTSRTYVTSVIALLDIVLLFITAIVVFIASRIRLREAELTRLYGREREAVERLEELDRMKSDFLATVSHELRTPVTVIQGAGLTLERMWDSLDDDTRRDLLSGLTANAMTLQELITNLLDLSRLLEGMPQMEFAPIDLSAVVRRPADRLASLSDTPSLQCW